MNDFGYVFAPTALDADGICAAQQLVGAGNLLINGALAVGGVVTLGEQAHVTLYSAADLHLVNFTVSGTTTAGVAVSEVIAGPNNGTVTTTANFKTITQVAADAAVGSNVTVGNSNTLETSWRRLNGRAPLKGISVHRSANANYTYEVQYAPGPLQAADGTPIAETAQLAIADATLTNKTTSAGTSITTPWGAIRVKITAFVAGSGTLRVLESVA